MKDSMAMVYAMRRERELRQARAKEDKRDSMRELVLSIKREMLKGEREIGVAES